MNADRSPVTHKSNIDATDFWRTLDTDKKKEYLHIDTLYNRQFLERSRALAFGAVSGLALSLLLLRVRNRFVLATISSGLSCAVFCQLRSSPVHSQYFKVWEHVKNDKEALEAVRQGSESLSSDDFNYFYHRYLRFFYPEIHSATISEQDDRRQ